MDKLHFRNAERADLPALVAMMADDVLGAAREDASLPLDPGYAAAFEAIQSQANQRLIVATLDGRAVGTEQLAFLPGLARKGAWRGVIEAVHVRGDKRSQGLGAELIAWAVKTARAHGDCPFLQLTSDKRRLDAHRFYERLGFQRSHEGFKLVL